MGEGVVVVMYWCAKQVCTRLVIILWLFGERATVTPPDPC